MKKKDSICMLLGMTQENLAQILQVSRSQISMFELGKRSLPVAATKKLAQMLTHLKDNEISNKKSSSNAKEREKIIQNLLLENAYQKAIIAAKIVALEKKQKKFFSSKMIISHLINEEKNSQKDELNVLKTIASKKDNNFDLNLLRLSIKRDVLKYEEKLLKKKLGNIVVKM